MNLLIRDFPDDLVLKLKELTGESCASKAVTRGVRILFDLSEAVDHLQRSNKEMSAKFDCLLAGVRARSQGERDFCIAVSRVMDPNFFSLEREEYRANDNKKSNRRR